MDGCASEEDFFKLVAIQDPNKPPGSFTYEWFLNDISIDTNHRIRNSPNVFILFLLIVLYTI